MYDTLLLLAFVLCLTAVCWMPVPFLIYWTIAAPAPRGFSLRWLMAFITAETIAACVSWRTWVYFTEFFGPLPGP